MEYRETTAVLQARAAAGEKPALVCSAEDSWFIYNSLEAALPLDDDSVIDQPCGGTLITLTLCDVPPEDVVLAKPYDAESYTVYAGFVTELNGSVTIIEAPTGRLYTKLDFFNALLGIINP